MSSFRARYGLPEPEGIPLNISSLKIPPAEDKVVPAPQILTKRSPPRPPPKEPTPEPTDDFDFDKLLENESKISSEAPKKKSPSKKKSKSNGEAPSIPVTDWSKVRVKIIPDPPQPKRRKRPPVEDPETSSQISSSSSGLEDKLPDPPPPTFLEKYGAYFALAGATLLTFYNISIALPRTR
jgi:hypothetical protein